MSLAGRRNLQCPELVLLTCDVPEPFGLSLPGKDFCVVEKSSKKPHSSCFLITNAAVLSVVVALKSFKCAFKDNVAVKH